MQSLLNSLRSPVSRRRFLAEFGGGLGSVAFAAMLAEEGASAQEPSAAEMAPRPLAAKIAHHPPQAKRVIQIFCPGGISHVDTWDYRPELERRAGQPFDPNGELTFFASKPGNCQPSFWKFRQHGESGKWMSDLFPRLSKCVDDIAFIHSMQSKSALHGPAMFMMNSGFIRPGFPSMGAWVTYGLGSESENMPAFVVLPDTRGLPPGGVLNWGAGFLPAVHQGTVIQTTAGEPPIADLFPADGHAVSTESENAGRAFLQQLNRKHAADRPGDSILEARIASYELAARLQLAAPEVTDLSRESEATHHLYATEHEEIGPFGRQCLLARRMVERGVRFVQIFCGAENTAAEKIRPNWDSHEDLPRDHGYWGQVLDRGASALLTDLKQRGMLESTLVICTTEFGRQPAAQGGKGRDHNPGAFTAWMAGGGIRGGVSFGSSDELGFKAEENPTYCYDLHATALHLLGLNHEQLTYYHNGIQRRITDVHGHVLTPLIS
ncbi:DUF1501 domain-containing protein [Blastopirellula sp. J2-11]|uniref:DUF1501 domain-containing protein n=1 Tax=Blastopirellula sp. J2-11 TaxID=2943192 RepID=UPI0021CA60F5|nr:DUF1501 domain-containing protein [Blastopirellula sp. J2-11]UUO04897.1 DUF1501 domain-containing protein [Blastopirellula sp. J2-11]